MASIAQTTNAPPVEIKRYVWEAPVRLSHWVNAISIGVLFLTGLFIASPTAFPNGEAYNHFLMGKMRLLHFAFGFALVIGVALRTYWFFVGNNYARSGFPFFWRASWYKAVFGQIAEYMKPVRGHIHIGHNSLAGFSYTIFFLMCGFEGVTGLALYGETNPGGFWDRVVGWTTPILGGSFRVHMWHHLVAWFIVVFVIFHLYIALYDAWLYKNGLIDSIIAGEKFVEPGDHDAETWVS